MPTLSALGFCGADDSVNPRHLALLAQSYPTVEWGILFRPDKEGTPRYATSDWVGRLADLLKIHEGGTTGRLAAHLCGSRVNDLLSSSTDDTSARKIDSFLEQLCEWGFRRVQVNATAVNGVVVERLSSPSAMRSFLRTVQKFDKLEFIVQKNGETEPLWAGLLADEKRSENVVFLHDESKGTGKEAGGFCEEERFVRTERRVVGFAGVSLHLGCKNHLYNRLVSEL